MKYIHRSLISFIFLALFLVSPIFVHAQASSIAELQAQVQILTVQLEALKAQIANKTKLYTRDLTIGSTGIDVRDLQVLLEWQGYLKMPAGVAKGYFGTLTRAAIIKFQTQAKIPVTGIADSVTRMRIYPQNGPDPIGDQTLKITPKALPDAYMNVSYNQILKAEGFSGDITWELVSGALPEGLSLNKNFTVCPAIYPSNCVSSETYQGFIAGQAGATGTYNFTVQASGGGKTVTKSYTLVVNSELSVCNFTSGDGYEFYSTSPQEVGLGPNGPVSGYWSIYLSKNNSTFGWHHSDVIESLPYTCSGNTLTVTMTNGTTAIATYDASTKVLLWQKLYYKPVFQKPVFQPI